MSDAKFCTCGRPKWTAADLKRWQDEIAEFSKGGGDARLYNPTWAREICWFSPRQGESQRCPMRPVAS